MKRAQFQLMFGIMIFVMVFITAVILAPVLKDFIETGRDSSNLDCENTSITTATQMTCAGVALALPMFYFTLLAAGATFLVVGRK